MTAYWVWGITAGLLFTIVLLVILARGKLRSLIKTERIHRDIGVLILIARFGNHLSGKCLTIQSREKTEKSNTDVLFPDGPSSDMSAVIEGLAQGAWIGLDVSRNLLQIDEHVYEAMGNLAGEQFNTIGDLRQYLSSWESVELGKALPLDAVNKLKGHLAESIVAQHLEDYGVEVEMPDISNQPGYDIVLNGEYFVNVKAVSDFSSVVDHLEKYPGIPVIVPEDMAGIPSDAIYLNATDSIEKLAEEIGLGGTNIVMVDDKLSNEALTEQTETVGDVLLGNPDVYSAIPVITVALSGYRELRLIMEQKTNLPNSLKNFGLDMTGTGGGSMAGMIIASTVTDIFLPGVGTVIFGIGGGIIGRKITNKIKERPLKKALENLEEAYQSADEEVRELQKEANRRYQKKVQKQEVILADSTTKIKEELQAEKDNLLDQRRTVYRMSSTLSVKYLESATIALQNERESLLAIPTWMRWLSGKTLWQSLNERIAYLENLSQNAELQRDIYAIKEKRREELVGDQVIRFLQILLDLETETDSILHIVRSFEAHRNDIESKWEQYILGKRRVLADIRYKCIQKIGKHIQSEKGRINKKVDEIRKKLRQIEESVKVKKKRLGR